MSAEKKVKQPITKGVAKVPVVMQMEALECGAASLAMILAYYGKDSIGAGSLRLRRIP